MPWCQTSLSPKCHIFFIYFLICCLAAILHFLSVAAAELFPLSLSLSLFFCLPYFFPPPLPSSSFPLSLHPGGQKPRLIAFSIAHGFLEPPRPNLCSKRTCSSASEHRISQQSLLRVKEHTVVVHVGRGGTMVGLPGLSDIIRYWVVKFRLVHITEQVITAIICVSTKSVNTRVGRGKKVYILTWITWLILPYEVIILSKLFLFLYSTSCFCFCVNAFHFNFNILLSFYGFVIITTSLFIQCGKRRA